VTQSVGRGGGARAHLMLFVHVTLPALALTEAPPALVLAGLPPRVLVLVQLVPLVLVLAYRCCGPSRTHSPAPRSCLYQICS
jgi:hypothetical protein